MIDKIKIFFIFAILILAVVAIDMAEMNRASNTSKTSKFVYAFWPYWTDPEFYQPDWNSLTHVVYHSWEINDDGRLIPPDDIDRYYLVRNISHNHNVKIIISVMSFDESKIDNLLAYHKYDLADNISDTLTGYGADGVNIDFEYPNTQNLYEDVPNKQLLEDFLEILHETNVNRSIFVDVPGGNEKIYKNNNLSKYIDGIFLMGYDYHYDASPLTGHPSPYKDIVNSVNILKNYYPSRMIILGLPFYGYDWNSSSKEPGSNTLGKGETISMVEAIQNAKINGRIWDDESKGPWYIYENNGSIHQVWYDDVQSLTLKIDFAKSSNIGVGFWALGYEGNNASIWKIVKDNYK